MALTSGAKKFGITVVVAAVIAGGGYYVTQKKHLTATVPAVATVESVPVKPEPIPAVGQPLAEPMVPPAVIKEEPVVHKKKHVNHVASHKPVQVKSYSSDDTKALKELAGDKL